MQADAWYPDCWASIGAMAAVTQRLRFSVAVYVLPLRNPFEVARATGTLAILSSNRFILGAGTGWMKEEFDIYGVDFRSRGKRFDEYLDVLRLLWRGGMVEYHGQHFDFPPLQISPAPHAPVPIFLGGAAPVALERAARKADGWIGAGNLPDEVPALLAEFARLRQAAGRDHLPFETVIGLKTPPDLATFQRLEAAGHDRRRQLSVLFTAGQALDARAQEAGDGRVRRAASSGTSTDDRAGAIDDEASAHCAPSVCRRSRRSATSCAICRRRSRGTSRCTARSGSWTAGRRRDLSWPHRRRRARHRLRPQRRPRDRADPVEVGRQPASRVHRARPRGHASRAVPRRRLRRLDRARRGRSATSSSGTRTGRADTRFGYLERPGDPTLIEFLEMPPGGPGGELMRFWLSLVTNTEPDQLPAIARHAEEVGFHGVTVPDHLVMSTRIESKYPYTEDGKIWWPDDMPWLDPWVALSAMGAVTSRLKLATNIYLAALRDPFTPAKAVSSAAAIAPGRVVCGVSVGWIREEYQLAGVDFGTRGKRMDELIEVMRKLWSGREVSHHGRFFNFDHAIMCPPPPSPVPIWCGGGSPAALARAAMERRMARSADDARAAATRLRPACTRCGAKLACRSRVSASASRLRSRRPAR